MPAPKDSEAYNLWKKRISESHIGLHKGKKLPQRTEEHRRKLSESKKGKSLSEETRRKISDAHKGKKLPQRTEEHRRKLSESLKNSSALQKYASERKGKPGPKRSQESRLKQSLTAKGKPKSEEMRKRLSLSKTGVPRSDDVRIKIIESKIGPLWYGNVRYHGDDLYCERFTEELKERVRAYRGYVCFECGTKQNGQKLDVHHVFYNKRLCCDDTPRLLIPLCHSCHSKTNHNRREWSQHFSEMVYSLDPKGKCFFTKEEMKSYLRDHPPITTNAPISTRMPAITSMGVDSPRPVE